MIPPSIENEIQTTSQYFKSIQGQEPFFWFLIIKVIRWRYSQIIQVNQKFLLILIIFFLLKGEKIKKWRNFSVKVMSQNMLITTSSLDMKEILCHIMTTLNTKDMTNDPHYYYKNVKVINFDIIHHKCDGDP